jgi:hypothetical protein
MRGTAKRASKADEEKRRLRVLRELELAREAERRRNGLGADRVRTEKPASPARAVPLNPGRKRSKKVSDPRARTLPRLKPGTEGGSKKPHSVASAYMRMTPEEWQRERRRRAEPEKKRRERKPAKDEARAAEQSAEGRRPAKTNATRPQGKAVPADNG